MFAEIIINSNARALNRIFDYIVPKQLENSLKIGARVVVPFGKGAKLEDGFVINLKEKSEFANREICQINTKESLTEENIILAKLMARKYFCNLSDCIKLMLPPGTGGKILKNRTKEKTGNFVFLKKDEDEINFLIETGKLKSEKQIRVAKFLLNNDGIYTPDLEVLTEVSQSIFKTMQKNGIIEIIEKPIERNPFATKRLESDMPRKLTDEQKNCFDGIAEDIEANQYSKNLIFGITGSRKNRNLFTINCKSPTKGKNSCCSSTGNIAYTTNGRPILGTFWRNNCGAT